ncbi:MAG: hypothetical protein L3J21_03090 [Devosiaceae bacterium]|nr:hypothetical protein [Devosiaceae bacterium]
MRNSPVGLAFVGVREKVKNIASKKNNKPGISRVFLHQQELGSSGLKKCPVFGFKAITLYICVVLMQFSIFNV